MARKRRLYKIDTIISRREEDIYKHAQFYEDKLAGRKVTYYYHAKGIPKRRTIFFYRRNFMHLCGVKWYEDTGWRGFYEHSVREILKANNVYTLQPVYVEPKLDVLEQLPKLLDSKHIGFSDGAITHKNTHYGEMLRTREDLVALGTVEDTKTRNLVPMSLINLEVSDDGMRKSTSNWCKIFNLRVEDIDEENDKFTNSKNKMWDNQNKQKIENRRKKEQRERDRERARGKNKGNKGRRRKRKMKRVVK